MRLNWVESSSSRFLIDPNDSISAAVVDIVNFA